MEDFKNVSGQEDTLISNAFLMRMSTLGDEYQRQIAEESGGAIIPSNPVGFSLKEGSKDVVYNGEEGCILRLEDPNSISRLLKVTGDGYQSFHRVLRTVVAQSLNSESVLVFLPLSPEKVEYTEYFATFVGRYGSHIKDEESVELNALIKAAILSDHENVLDSGLELIMLPRSIWEDREFCDKALDIDLCMIDHFDESILTIDDGRKAMQEDIVLGEFLMPIKLLENEIMSYEVLRGDYGDDKKALFIEAMEMNGIEIPEGQQCLVAKKANSGHESSGQDGPA